MDNKKIAIILGVVCMVLTFSMMIQFKTINAVSTSISGSSTENKLRDEVLKWKERYDYVYRDLEEAEEKLENVRKKATDGDGDSANIQEELKLVNRLLGYTELTGKGAIITLDDSKIPTSTEGSTSAGDSLSINLSDYVIHDGDLIAILNEIKNGGVDAISINDQRIVNTTGITCDGNVVRINREKVAAPYVIRAIGSPEGIVGALNMLGGYVEILKRAGISVDIKKSNSITIPKYNGVFDVEYTRVLK